MYKFWLIQRGFFEEKGKYLTGDEGLVTLNYMGSAEFEFGAIPKAFRRLMYHFLDYDVFHTSFFTPDGEELLVFCNKKKSEDIIKAIKYFIENPYHLKEFSQLERVTKDKKEEKTSHYYTNFWWCIDDNRRYCGDWMAFLSPKKELFVNAITNDYNDWWLKKTKKEREEEYHKSLRW